MGAPPASGPTAPGRSSAGQRLGLRSLRARLVAGVVGVAVVSLVVSGVASVALLRDSQLRRIDDQLRRFASASESRPSPVVLSPQPEEVRSFEAPTDFVLVLYDGSGTRIQSLGNTGVPGPLLEDPRDLLARGALEPFTVPADGDGPDWRVQVVDTTGDLRVVGGGGQRLPGGEDAAAGGEGAAAGGEGAAAGGEGAAAGGEGAAVGGEVEYAVIGISLAELDATVGQLRQITVAVAVVMLAGLAGLAVAVVRLGLRPLTAVESTAASIAGAVTESPEGLAAGLARRVPGEDQRTETGRLAAVLNLLLDRIEAALSAKQASEDRLRRFVADASHELRTPLTAVRGFAELSRRGGLRDLDGYRRAMRRVEAEAVRMARLVEDLLLLAQLDEHRELASDPVDLAVLARDAVVDAEARQPDRPIRLTAGSAVVHGDEHRLRQVVGNLVGNALAHTPDDATLTVAVAAGHYAEPPDCVAAAGGELAPGDRVVVLTVADSGSGVPSEHAAHVFDRFYRAAPGRSRRTGGSGLGLSIVASVVAAHGGRVELVSPPGTGAVFRVVLPRPGTAGPGLGYGAGDPAAGRPSVPAAPQEDR